MNGKKKKRTINKASAEAREKLRKRDQATLRELMGMANMRNKHSAPTPARPTI